MESRFLLLLGPSGVGKTEIIKRLRLFDERFVYISPYMTRKLRKGEVDKVPVSAKELDRLVREKKILVVNTLYRVRYATPKGAIEEAFKACKFPVLDWPMSRISVMEDNFPNRLLRIYVETADLETLRQRLLNDNRDPQKLRLNAGIAEFEQLQRGEFDAHIDVRIVNPQGEIEATAKRVYDQYLQAVGES